jgi:short subunit dehydrogenase-like uncharacterized protein
MEVGGMTDEVWILGATGRSGRAIAARLAGSEVAPVLVGRDAARLAAIAPRGARTVVAGSVTAMAAEVRRQRPAVVVNTVGPFTDTAVTIAEACLPGSHYLDLANDVISSTHLLRMHERALAAGRTLITGAGFGVLATESVVAMLCRDRPTPTRVRVDAVASLEVEAGEIGDALAATIVDGVPEGGRRFRGGCLVRSAVGSDAMSLSLPDGTTVTTASVPFGDLVAAWRASGAPEVVAASSLAPSGPAVRAVLPVVGALFAVRPLRELARRRLARVSMKARPRPREHSYGHAVVEWSDGTVRDGWLRAGDASTFTAATAAETALALARGDARPGADTPVGALGPELALAAGAEFLLDGAHTATRM